MPLIIDVQGYLVENNKFIPKELAAFNGYKSARYIFKPPLSKKLLLPNIAKTADWLSHNHHCIDWDHGYTPTFHFDNIIKELTETEGIIYVKGQEKAVYRRRYTYIKTSIRVR